jgi:hypothetical protein
VLLTLSRRTQPFSLALHPTNPVTLLLTTILWASTPLPTILKEQGANLSHTVVTVQPLVSLDAAARGRTRRAACGTAAGPLLGPLQASSGCGPAGNCWLEGGFIRIPGAILLLAGLPANGVLEELLMSANVLFLQNAHPWLYHLGTGLVDLKTFDSCDRSLMRVAKKR